MYQLRTLRRHAPVAIGVAHEDSVDEVAGLHVHQPPLHGVVMLAYGLYVAIAGVYHVCHGDKSPRPGHIVRIVAPIGRRHVGERAVLPLAVFEVLQPFGVKSMVVEDIRFAVVARGAVSRPAHPFVSLRAVGRHTAVVAADSPIGIAVNGIHHLVRAFESPCGLHRVIHHQPFEILQLGRDTGGDSCDLHIPESVIDKRGMPAPVSLQA